MSRREEWRKNQIRSAAIRCFVRRGYAATRLLDIAQEAGLSKGGVYFHYRAKEQLFQDIVDAWLSQIQDRWQFEPMAEEPVKRSLEGLVLMQLAAFEDNPDDTRLQQLLVSMAPQDETHRAKLQEALKVMQTLYVGVLTRGMQQGVFASSDAEQTAQIILAMVQGMAVQVTISDGRLPVPPEMVVRCVLRMVAVESPRSGTAETRVAAPMLA